MAQNTLKGYDYDIANFAAWCARVERRALPATPETLSLYITDLLLNGKKVTTISRYVAGIAYAHKNGKLDNPYTDSVKALLKGVRRMRAERKRQMAPISVAQVRRICRKLAGDGSAQAVRDRALLVFGFASALRRSNLSWVRVQDIELLKPGFLVYIGREKQNRSGQAHRFLGIPYGKHPSTCPVRCLQAWLRIRGKSPGPLFTRIDNRAHLGQFPLSGNAIRIIVQRALSRIGVDPRGYGSHSLRAGHITEAGIAKVNELVIQRQSGHKSLDMLRDYFRPTDVFRANSCSRLGL